MYHKKQNLKKVTLANRLQNVNGKTFVAVVLFVIMGLLWARVLLTGGSQPAPADAGSQEQIQQTQTPVAAPVTLIPVKLPVIEGRHDTLAADIFNARRSSFFKANTTDDEHKTVSQNTGERRHQENLEKIAATIKLEAVVRGNDGVPLQVFVNNTILTVGSVLTVKEGPQEYELVLKEIKENEAMFVWRDFTVTLSMAKTLEK